MPTKTKRNYKDEQKATREALIPKILEKSYGRNRRQTRFGIPTRFTNKESKHVVNDYRLQREENKIPANLTNHQRHVMNRVNRDRLRNNLSEV